MKSLPKIIGGVINCLHCPWIDMLRHIPMGEIVLSLVYVIVSFFFFFGNLTGALVHYSLSCVPAINILNILFMHTGAVGVESRCTHDVVCIRLM